MGYYFRNQKLLFKCFYKIKTFFCNHSFAKKLLIWLSKSVPGHFRIFLKLFQSKKHSDRSWNKLINDYGSFYSQNYFAIYIKAKVINLDLLLYMNVHTLLCKI